MRGQEDAVVGGSRGRLSCLSGKEGGSRVVLGRQITSARTMAAKNRLWALCTAIPIQALW
jgi:hypothetical protein